MWSTNEREARLKRSPFIWFQFEKIYLPKIFWGSLWEGFIHEIMEFPFTASSEEPPLFNMELPMFFAPPFQEVSQFDYNYKELYHWVVSHDKAKTNISDVLGEIFNAISLT